MRFIAWLIEAIRSWAYSIEPDAYVSVTSTTRSQPEAVEIPDYLRGPEVPYLGADQDELLLKALAVSHDKQVQINWLKAVRRLRTEVTGGWILDGGRKPNWGVSDTKDAQALNQPRNNETVNGNPNQFIKGEVKTFPRLVGIIG